MSDHWFCARVFGVAAVLALGTSCGGPNAARTGAGTGKLPPQVTDTSEVSEAIAPFPGVGARCKGQGMEMCSCREVDIYGRGVSPDGDVETSPPPEGHKRYELRTGRGDDTMRITVEGVGTFVKSGPTPDARCIYVDLPAGAFRVRYHVTAAHPSQGAEPRLRISEYSPRWKRWYRTFAFRCTDGSQPCTKNLAQDYFEILIKQTDGKFDPCGSTKVQGMRFWTDREPEAAVGEFNLQLVLNIYKFAPRFPPDTARCKGAGYDVKPPEAEEGMTVTPAEP
jgi:hypothetical protein